MKTNRTNQVASDQKLIAGVEKLLPKGPLHIAGKTYTTKEVVAVLQARVDAVLAAEAARGQWLGMLNEEKTQLAQTKEFVDGLRRILLGMFASDFVTLHELGLAPRKRRVLDAEALVAKVDKMRATRAARHTLGRKQREAITGEDPQSPPAIAAPAEPTANARHDPRLSWTQ